LKAFNSQKYAADDIDIAENCIRLDANTVSDVVVQTVLSIKITPITRHEREDK